MQFCRTIQSLSAKIAFQGNVFVYILTCTKVARGWDGTSIYTDEFAAAAARVTAVRLLLLVIVVRCVYREPSCQLRYDDGAIQ